MKKLLGILVLSLFWFNSLVAANNNIPGAIFDMKRCISTNPRVVYNIFITVNLDKNNVRFGMSGNKNDFRAEGYYPIDKISGTKIYTQEIAVIELYPSSYNPPSLERLAAENAFTHLEIDTKNKTIIQKGNAPYNSNKKIRKGIKEFFGKESGHLSTDFYNCKTLYVQKGKTLPKAKKKDTVKKIEPGKIYAVSSGTGFFINRSGNIISNNHVIDQCSSIKVHYKGTGQKVKVLATDRANDLSLMKANFKPDDYFPIANEDAELLEDIYVAGYPFGKVVSSSVKVTKGVVSALTGIGNNYSNIQIDAALQPGNSGGPIIDQKGNVVGVAVAKLDYKKVIKDFGAIPEGTNFGIKSSTVKQFLKANNTSSASTHWMEMSKKDIGTKIKKATVYLNCWMTAEKIQQLKTRKAFFADIK